MVALVDNMVLSYLVEAMSGWYDPALDPQEHVRAEKEAAARLWMWAAVAVGETAVRESQQTSDSRRREALKRCVSVQLPELQVPATDALEERVGELLRHHKGVNDCRVVAEAEVLGAPAVVTFDKRLKRHLRGHARVPIRYPSQQWKALGIPRGTPPVWMPRQDNPLYRHNWWRW
jgi:predicted nucleic-acid-binding protein